MGKLKLSLKKKLKLKTAKTANKPADDAQQDDEPVATTDNPSKPEPAEVADEAVATEA